MNRNNICLTNDTDLKDNSITLSKLTELKKMNLISIDSIFEKYPFIKTEMGWTSSNIELFLESFLVLGEKTEKETLIDTISFEKLIEFHRNVQKDKK